ncbi:hypothetical protein I6F48_03500 [Pseudoalteromonas sp. SWYJ118]|uniref:hypothetical protein n=1 Tax=Pseudoalteromonas sp. SWYJ118 TaxID=2792062 RepID=UPI0018CE144E|nr:hypothetical protein [Pseudoalteromonas sp. SWYJ118]MBH0074628.1 hypothetical protein [Pseudoalteromonas sp. SWYJ118]
MAWLYSIMDWLFLIFADKAQQAQLIAILVSAVIAILVVLLNQCFLSKRAKKEIYIKKIEEFYNVIMEYQQYSFNYVFECKNQLQTKSLSNNKVIDSIDKMEMLSNLYFSEVKMQIDELRDKHKSLETLPFEEAMGKVKSNVDKLKNISTELIVKYQH